MSPKPAATLRAIGEAGHGKTTLAAALARVSSGAPPGSIYAERLHSVVEYETPFRRYLHHDEPVASAHGVDGVVLVVAAPDGPGEAARRQAFVARHLGAGPVVVFVNRCDRAPGEPAVDAVEAATRAMLCDVGLAGDDAPVVRGAALPALQGDARWEASVRELADALDRHVPDHAPPADGPFRMQIEWVAEVRPGGYVAAGRVERGMIRLGDPVELLGIGARRATHVAGIEMSRRMLTEARAGEGVGILLRSTSGPVVPGRVLVAPDSVASAARFRARLGAYGAARWSHPGAWRFHFGAAVVEGAIAAAPGDPGDGYDAVADVTLDAPWALEAGARFLVYDGEGLAGGGVVDAVPG